VGGVWSSERLYPGLKSNNMVGTYEYSDFPMDEATFGVKAGQHIPGHVIHEYLTAYAKKFDVLHRIRFNTKVETVEKQDKGGWVLWSGGEKSKSIFAKKLIVATGVTSQAFLPTFEGQDSFGVPLFHSKDFLQHADTIKTSKRVTVLGGTKSAWDAVYAYGTDGVEVDWVIRGNRNYFYDVVLKTPC
jgi:cation diffusion facilitator CzcD-associated flavoprotein CzcO